ncbi:MAG: HEAT repeat domain-containing protein [Cytophagales bacterium]|nr:HEAT repeat domain-containing protein [Cytophagales bacterium]
MIVSRKSILAALLPTIILVGCTPFSRPDKPKPAGTATAEPAPEAEKYSGSAFSDHVRATEPRSPEEEKAGFKLPPGFEIELFAAEPQIGKPINLAFDAKGRLWVTESFEYPFAADPGKGKDRIAVLEDADGDGKADRFTHLADTLNIPIGVLPVPGGAVAHSIPNLYRFADADGDGRAESSHPLLGPFGYKDTHGMVSNLTRGFDGWVHACHGFTNASRVAGRDGDSVRMESGNTFRFRPDGSRVEQTTFGRVNPFGMVFDERGYLYSSDCHSSPLYQLITGADYPHFGKKEEGIGFAPAMKPQGKESTALSGLAYYADELFPPEYRHNLFLGDVVTSRVYRNSFAFQGSTPVARAEADFLLSQDPWFRPVDVKMGPDGALYVADFYNRIIGHYEVPLNNPGRDRIRGRIWRITYRGDGKQVPRPARRDWSVAPADELLEALSHPNLPVRLTAADQLTERVGAAAVAPVRELLQAERTGAVPYSHGLWVLHRLGALPEALLSRSLAHREALVRVHALRVLKETSDPDRRYAGAVLAALLDPDPHVQRAAAEALPAYPTAETVKALLAFARQVPAHDTHLRYTAKLGLRTLLRQEPLAAAVTTQSWDAEDTELLAGVMTGVPSAAAGQFLFRYVTAHAVPKERLVPLLQHVARYADGSTLDPVVAFARRQFADDLSIQYSLYNTLQQGLSQRGGQVGNSLLDWGAALAESFIGARNAWTYGWSGSTMLRRNPVMTYTKKTDTGTLSFIGFDQSGFRGTIRSPRFEVPDSLSFTVLLSESLAKGESNAPSGHVVRLRAAADTATILAQTDFMKDASPERQLKTHWDLRKYRGQQAYLEIKYAPAGYVHAGGFAPAVVAPPAIGPNELAKRQKFALEVIGTHKLVAFAPAVKACLADPVTDPFVKVAAARTLLQLDAPAHASLVGALLADGRQPVSFRKEIAEAMGEFALPGLTGSLVEALPGAPLDFQLALVKALAAAPAGKTALLDQVRGGKLNPRLLLDPKVEERLLLNASDAQRRHYRDLTANLDPVNQERETLIRQRLAKFSSSPIQQESGRVIFIQNCATCHQIKKEGGLIGPQLDGVGNWGAQLLATKILDPNRNISEAFRTYTIRLNNGKVLTGLYRREEGQVLVFANPGGEEFSVAKKDIAEKQGSKYTLMPDYFGEVLEQENFNALLTYLLAQQ